MKSTLIRWGLCWGLSVLAVQMVWAQGIPALPPGAAAEQPPPPLPPGVPLPAEPAPAVTPLPGGIAPAPAATSCTSCGAACTNGACTNCGAGMGGYGSGYDGQGSGYGDGWFAPRDPINLPHFNTFGSLEYLSVWSSGQDFPVLVTTSNPGAPRYRNNNPDVPNAGVLGRGGIPLFGGPNVNSDQKNGARMNIGIFLNPDNTVSWVNRFTAIDGGVARFDAASNGTQTLARPFFDPVNINPSGENALLLSFIDPNGNATVARGSVNAAASMDLYVVDTYIRSMVHNDGLYQLDLLAGFEYTRFDNDLSIQSKHIFLPNPGPVIFNVHDLITAKNNFYGGVIGFDLEKRYGRFSIDTLAKVALGSTRQQVDLHGAGTRTVGGVRSNLNGAFFVQQTNAGPTLNQTYSRDVWSVVPELNVTLGWWITPHLKATLGYTGIYWTNQVQAGDVIDRRINFTQQAGPIVGPAVPAFKFSDSDFWVQGFHTGIAWDY